MLASGILDRVIILLINGMSVSSAEAWCVTQQCTAADARRVVSQARKKITVAAEYSRDEQIGRAVLRLDDLYAKSVAAKDIRTALHAQKELNRLLSLHEGSRERGGDSDDEADGRAARATLELIASYLLPLALTDVAYPVEEHARIAADLIRQHKLRA